MMTPLPLSVFINPTHDGLLFASAGFYVKITRARAPGGMKVMPNKLGGGHI